MTWNPTAVTEDDLGYFRIFFTPPNGQRTEVTFFRNLPTIIENYTSADPFGDATLSLNFPQIGLLDDLGHGELAWFQEFADVDVVLQYTTGDTQPVWEGFVASIDWRHQEDSTLLSVTCQGALFQVDRYVSKPEYPGVSISHEQLIAETFSQKLHPHLRTRELAIEWPDNWQVLAYRTEGVVGLQAGGKATGFKTRVTGAWEKSLTGFIANLLSVMWTSDYADQWTIRNEPGRKPVMYIRFASRPADISLVAGQPGVGVQLSRDFTQYANVIYGSGTTVEGSSWSRQAVSRDNTRTDYVPMASDPRVNTGSQDYSTELMRAETYVQFEDGMEVTDALKTSQLMLRRNQDPGYTGSITLNIDPSEMSRYLIRAGMTVKLKYFAGTGSSGINLHISQVEVSVTAGTVTLTVDSKYRDALTVEETIARTRDPLTPIKMLQIGKQSILIPDQLAPWSYALGSGYVPKASKPLFDTFVATDEIFPFETAIASRPPKSNPSYYIGINAAASARKSRWAGPIPIRMAEKGDIRLTQFALFDRDGHRLKIPFHVSLYYVNATVDNMPFDGSGPSPFIPGAFQSNNEFGQPIPAGSPGATALPQETLIIGWGDADQPAGFSPGTKTNGDPATGLLVDETTWSFDNTNNPDFQKNPAVGFTQPETALTVYAMLYAEYHDWVYAIGRLYRKEPGT